MARKPKKPKKRKPKTVPRLGPPENLRPAGAHADKRKRLRERAERLEIEAEQRPDNVKAG